MIRDQPSQTVVSWTRWPPWICWARFRRERGQATPWGAGETVTGRPVGSKTGSKRAAL